MNTQPLPHWLKPLHSDSQRDQITSSDLRFIENGMRDLLSRHPEVRTCIGDPNAKDAPLPHLQACYLDRTNAATAFRHRKPWNGSEVESPLPADHGEADQNAMMARLTEAISNFPTACYDEVNEASLQAKIEEWTQVAKRHAIAQPLLQRPDSNPSLFTFIPPSEEGSGFSRIGVPPPRTMFSLGRHGTPLSSSLQRLSGDEEPRKRRKLFDRYNMHHQPSIMDPRLQRHRVDGSLVGTSASSNGMLQQKPTFDTYTQGSRVSPSEADSEYGSSIMSRPSLAGGQTFDQHRHSHLTPFVSAASPSATTIMGRFDEELAGHGSLYHTVLRNRAGQSSRNDMWDHDNTHNRSFDPYEDDPHLEEDDAYEEAHWLDSLTTSDLFANDANQALRDEGEVDSDLNRTFEKAMRESYMAYDVSPNPLLHHHDDESLDVADRAPQTERSTRTRRVRTSAPLTNSTAAALQPGKKRRGLQKAPKTITPLERFVFIPDDDDNGYLKPLSHLPRPLADRLSSWLDALFADKKYFAKACTMTNRSNQPEYVQSGLCVAYHTIWKSKKNVNVTPHLQHACSTCCDAVARPCVRLQEDPANPRGDAILVFYPRPTDRRPSAATWTSAQFWLGVGARSDG